ncbi:GNAT family N-acetyltransferase [Changpingibacter yushuensis]|uniref:GNAT family N-acetyltransferase n=1 Tax=Changpingibacter yushuensis TaxID=2758440 RepID=UPI0021CDCF96|nr:DUF4081 domain-containing GNAT family N-acetyltransferase [Changpingibacter yushuensis]
MTRTERKPVSTSSRTDTSGFDIMRWPGRSATTLRRLYGIDRPKAIEFLDRDPVNSVLARANLDNAGIGAMSALGLFDNPRHSISALSWDSGNVIPLGFDDFGLDLLADSLLSRSRVCSSLVGPAQQVLGLWERLEPEWGPARDVRARQYSMVIEEPSLVEPDPLVRRATTSELSLVFPASVAMFTEEVGYDPTLYGSSYRRRAEGLVSNGLTFIKLGPDPDGVHERVIFKADVGALAGGVAQVQGVWTAPDLRGQGLATHAMAAVVAQILATLAPTVSLYVNDFNTAAVAVYRKVGFKAVEDWATILL